MMKESRSVLQQSTVGNLSLSIFDKSTSRFGSEPEFVTPNLAVTYCSQKRYVSPTNN